MADRIKIQVAASIDPASKTKMKQQLDSIARSLRLNLNTTGTGSFANLNRELNNLSNSVGRINTNLTTMNRGLGTVNTSARQTSTSIRRASRTTQTFATNLTNVAKKFAIWVGMANLVYAPFRAIQDGIRTLVEMDKLLIEISKVTNITAQEMENLAIQSTNVGTELGRTSQEFLTAYRDFSRAGLGDAADDLARMSLLLQNVGDLDVTQANQTLIATIEGMQLEYSEAIDVIDKMDNVANKNATSVNKLSQGMKNAASTFKLAGLDLDQSIALIGTGTATLQKSGSEIGNAWRTIVMRLQGVTDGTDTLTEDISKAEKALGSVGIAIRDGADSFRPVMDVLDELGDKFNTLSEVEQSYVTEALAGKMRANVLKATLLNYDMVQKQLTESQTSYGAALEENAKYMDGIEAKTKQLSATMTAFWQRSINSELIKQVVDMATAFVEFGRSIGGLPTIIIAVATAFVTWKILNTAHKIQLASSASMSFSAALKSVATSMNAAKLSAIGFQAVIASLSLVVSGIVLAIGYFVNKKEEAKLATEQLINSLEEEKQTIEKNLDEYNALITKQEEGQDVKKQLLALQENIIKSNGLEKDSIDLVNGSYEEQIKVIKELNLEKSKKIVRAGRGSYFEAQKSLEEQHVTSLPLGRATSGTEIEQIIESVRKVQENVDIAARKQLRIFTEAGLVYAGFAGNVEEGKEVLGSLSDELTKIQNPTKQQISLQTKLSEIYGNQSNIYKENTEKVKEYENALSEVEIGTHFQNDISKAEKAIESFKKTTDDATKIKLSEEVKKLGKNTIESANEMKLSENTIANLSDIWDGFNKQVDISTESLTQNISQIKETSQSLDDLRSDIIFLNQIEKELNDNRKLSANTIVEITKKYPELLGYINDEAGMLKAVKQAQLDKGNTAKQVLENELANSSEYWKKTIKGYSDLFNGILSNYGVDLTNFKSLSQAKLDIDNRVRGAIASGWSNLYSSYSPEQQLKAVIANVESRGVYSAEDAIVKSKQLSQLRAFEAQYSAIAEIGKSIEATVETIDFSGASLSGTGAKGKSGSTSGGSGRTVQADAALITRDRYFELNKELERYSQLIQKNQALQENATLTEKIKLLNEEIKLSKDKQKIIHNIAEENRRERAELVANLKTKGVKFTGVGDDLSITNTQQILDKQLAIVNKHRTDKNKETYNKLKENYEQFEKDINTFIKIQSKEVLGLQENWITLDSTINKLSTDINDLYIDQIKEGFTKFEQSLSKTEQALDDLDLQKQVTDTDDYTKSVQILNNQIKETNNLANTYKSELDRLNSIIPRNSEETSVLTEQIYKIKEGFNEAKNSAFQFQKTLTEIQYNQAMTSIKQYTSFIISETNKEIDKLEELKTIEEERFDAKIKAVNDEIEKLEYKNKQLDIEKTREEKLLEIEKEKLKLNEVKSVKKVKVFRAGQGFVWEADPRAIKESTDKLKELQQDFDDWEENLRREKEIEEKRKQIEIYEFLKRNQVNYYTGEIQRLQNFIDDNQDIIDKQQNEHITSLQELHLNLIDIDSNIYSDRLELLKTFVKNYNEELGKSENINILDSLSNKEISKTPIATETETTSKTPIKGALRVINVEKFADEGYTGKWSGGYGKLAMVHPEEFILNKNTVNGLMHGGVSSIMSNLPEISKQNISNSKSEVFNVENITVQTNDASKFIKDVRQIIRKQGR